MTEDQKQRLEQQLWKIANELRGKMGADEFRDYILDFIFYKYLSEKQLIHGEYFPTRETMRSAVFEYIGLDYNRTRQHTTIGNQSPVNFELAQAA